MQNHLSTGAWVNQPRRPSYPLLVWTLALVANLVLAFAQAHSQDVPRVLSYQGKVTSGGVPFNGTGQFKFALLAPSGSGASATAVLTGVFTATVNMTNPGSGYVVAPLVKFSGGGGSGAVATATISGGTVSGVNVTNPGFGYTSAPNVSFEAADGDYGVVWSNDGLTGTGEPSAAVGLNVSRGLFSARLGDTAFPNMAAIGAAAFTKAPLRLRVWFNDGTKGSQALIPDSMITAAAYSVTSVTASSAPQQQLGLNDLTASVTQSSGIILSTVLSRINSESTLLGTLNLSGSSKAISPPCKVALLSFGTPSTQPRRGSVTFNYQDGTNRTVDWSREVDNIPRINVANPSPNLKVSGISASAESYSSFLVTWNPFWVSGEIFVGESAALCFDASSLTGRSVFVSAAVDLTNVSNPTAQVTDSSGVVYDGLINSWIDLGSVKALKSIAIRGTLISPAVCNVPSLKCLVKF